MIWSIQITYHSWQCIEKMHLFSTDVRTCNEVNCIGRRENIATYKVTEIQCITDL